MGNFGEGLVGFLSQGGNAYLDALVEHRKRMMDEQEMALRRQQVEQAISESKQNMLLTKAQLEKHNLDLAQAKAEADRIASATMPVTEATDQGPSQGPVNVLDWQARNPGFQNEQQKMEALMRQVILTRQLEQQGITYPLNVGGQQYDVPAGEMPWGPMVSADADKYRTTVLGNAPSGGVNPSTVGTIAKNMRDRVRKDLGIQILSTLKRNDPTLGSNILALIQGTGSLEDYVSQGVIDPRVLAIVNALADREAEISARLLDPSRQPDITKEDLKAIEDILSGGVQGIPKEEPVKTETKGKFDWDKFLSEGED